MDLPKNDIETSDQLRQEHHELQKLLQRLSDAMAAHETRDQLARAVVELQDELNEHFHHEEVGGYFDEIMARAPRLEARVEEIKEQHPVLLALVRQLLECVENADTDEEASERLQADYQRFIKEFLSHEGEENDLLQQAYTDDIGAGD